MNDVITKKSTLLATHANQIREGKIKFIKVVSSKRTVGTCFFCEKRKSYTKNQWQRHLLIHTEEQFFFCRDCGQHFSNRNSHKTCSLNSIQNIYRQNNCVGDGYLAAFMCNICNYVQINESALVDHLKNQHAGLNNFEEFYEKCKFVNNLF